MFLVGQLAKEQQVGGALVAEVVPGQLAAHQLLHAVAAVVELALAGDALAVHGFAGDDFGNVGKAVSTPLPFKSRRPRFTSYFR